MYAPVVTWATVWYFLNQALINGWYTKQLEVVLAYTQADVERGLYMEIPKGIQIADVPSKEQHKYILKLIQNLYQKQAGRVWNQHLVKNLKKLGFTQSNVDECVFYFKRSVFLVYTDDTILLRADRKELEQIFKMLQMAFDVQDKGDLCDYLGIHIT